MAGSPATRRRLGPARVSIRELIEHEVDRRGYPGLMEWAEEHQTEFWQLAAKLLPARTELSGPDGGPIEQRAVDAPPRPATYAEWAEQRQQIETSGRLSAVFASMEADTTTTEVDGPGEDAKP